MLKVRHITIVLFMLFSSAASSAVQMNVNIGINVPAYPRFALVPGYPVYYAPQMEANYFFYDGLYWVYQDDNWYESSWYDGPWWFVDPDEVPLFLLRVPVRYYLMPPSYFIGWQYDAPPRWGDHWGRDWDQHRRGWDRWDRHAVPSPAPLPAYQRNYSGDRYPKQIEHQKELRQQNYGFQSRDPVVRKQNEHPQTIREQNHDQTTPREEIQRGKPDQDRQETNHNKGYEQRSNPRNDSPQQVMPTQQNNSQSYDQNRSKNEIMRDQKSMPNSQQQREMRVEQPNQRHEQRVIQPQEQQQQATQQKERDNHQGNNQERQPRQEQSRERGNRRDD
ncbi:hypothetical protein [Methylotenera versatilis]|uniref:Uncharacterized protein n=1 Tax=Methylotenera versatilis (strain 301) TaxID=666681 RepID=D7DPZ5_METV0|nr:hypothetical protein [Methylotenera versatilis]ADI29366.1 conserved hypothetical protein [Methylotenera versatilis 301]